MYDLEAQQGTVRQLEAAAVAQAAAALPPGAALSALRTLGLASDGAGSPWARSLDAAAAAGVALGRSLLNGSVGGSSSGARRDGRPVTLVGFGLGARVCFYAALTVGEAVVSARRRAGKGGGGGGGGGSGSGSSASAPLSGESAESLAAAPRQLLSYLHPGAILESVVCLGAPVARRAHEWRTVREACSGRVVNGYSVHDSLLRGAAGFWAIADPAGLWPVGQAAAEGAAARRREEERAARAASAAAAAAAARSSGAVVASPWGWVRGLAGGGAGGGAGSGSGGGSGEADSAASSDDEHGATGLYDRAEADRPADEAEANWAVVELPPSAGATLWWHGVENVDLSAHVKAHVDWERKLDVIMKKLGV